MALENYQFTFGAFTFGAGTPHQIIDLDGLEGLPDVRVQDDNRGFNDGMFTGRDFYSGRNLTFTIHTFAGGGNSAHQNFNLLQQALLPQQQGTTALQFLLSQTDTEKYMSARVRSRKTLIDPEYTYGFIKSQITMFANDPRYYDNVLLSAAISPSGVVGGRTYDRTYNLVYPNATAQGVSASITNTGWAISSPVITINGPASNITVGCLEQNASLTVNTTIQATDSLVIDLDQKIVTLNGSPIRNLVASGSTWFSATPGTSTFYMSALNTSPGVTAGTVQWRNAYV